MRSANSLVDDPFVKAAVSQVELRAEHQQDLEHLAATFVDPGVAVQLQNDNSQILYGRRGTGKTHLLKVIESHLRELGREGRQTAYVDMRQLGSSSVFQDPDRPVSVRVAGLFRDVLELVHGALLTYATDPAIGVPGAALDELEALELLIIRAVSKSSGTWHEPHRGATGVGGLIALDTALHGPLPEVGRELDQPAQGLLFSKIAQKLADALDACQIAHLTVLFDEWNQVPIDLQPMLAEFLRKALMCLPEVTVKIATLEYRTNFREARDKQNNVIGFELGADISTALELDEYFVYYGAKCKVPDHFGELLFRHVAREVDRQAGEPDYLERAYGLNDQGALLDALFVGRKTFLELVRAGEGVARDFINIFSKAFFASVRDACPKIGVGAVRAAAGEWFELDKALNLEAREERALEIICEQVIARNGTVNFLLSRREEHCALVRQLVDLRLIHLLKRAFRPNPKTPAARYNIYALDYGTYAHLLGGADAPELVSVEQMRNQKRPLVLIDELVSRLDAAVGSFRGVVSELPLPMVAAAG